MTVAPLETRLAALDTEDGTLALVYQPEVDLATGAIVAMEGLVRWHVQDLGVLAPGSFFAAAATAGHAVVRSAPVTTTDSGTPSGRIMSKLRFSAVLPSGTTGFRA